MSSTFTYSKLDEINNQVEDVVTALLEKGPSVSYRFLRKRLNESPENKALRLQKKSGMITSLDQHAWSGITPTAKTYLSEIRGRILFADLCKQNNVPVKHYSGTNEVTAGTIHQIEKATDIKSLSDQLAIYAMTNGGNRFYRF